MFYVAAHGRIYGAIEAMHSRGGPIDLIRVVDYLSAKDQLEAIGGKSFLVNLLADPVASVNIDQHAALLAEKYRRRQLVAASRAISELAFDQTISIEDVLEQSEQVLFRISHAQAVDDTMPEHIIEPYLRLYERNSLNLGSSELLVKQ